MNDIISRQAAIDALCRRCDLVAEDDEPCTEKCNDIRILEKLPPTQPEIIRCKDCMHNGSFDTDCPIHWKGKEYCSFAERLTDG